MGFDIEVEKYQRQGIGEIVLLKLKGDLKQDYLPLLDNVFQNLSEQGIGRIILDCTDFNSITSSGLGLLINMTQSPSIKQGIRLIHVQKKIKSLLDLLGLGDRLKIMEDKEKALASWG
ncbi:MAG: STAS domain-containing protein [Candidatus Brocadiae bacterium]|nr:STAS domain-containing protein [Candidatus Brocadiia bacterium]